MIANHTKPQVAIAKIRPTSIKPVRPGPTQCIRTCTKCIYNTDIQPDAEFEHYVALKTYDNLVSRKSIWFSKYQSIQYHLGQIDILRRSLDGPIAYTIYIVSLTNTKDLRYMEMIFNQVNLPLPTIIRNQNEKYDMMELLKSKKSIAIPIYSRSCVSDCIFLDFNGWHSDEKDEDCFGAKDLVNFFDTGIEKINKDINVNIVNMVITKDHDRFSLSGLGSICLQIMEPYTLHHYTRDLSERDKSIHLVQHIYHDAAKGSVIMPSHLVAFLILFMEREQGVSMTDLVRYIGWFRRIAIDIELHLGFTGSNEDAVKAGLSIIYSFILEKPSRVFRATNLAKLMIYAHKITPFVAYYGIVALAIQIESDKDKEEPHVVMLPNVPIKASRDRILETGIKLAEIVDHRVVCRKPCQTIENLILDSIGQLQLCGGYLEVIEPERNFDDDYGTRFDNLVMKTWIVVSSKQYKRDQLNLLINAVSHYLNQ